MPIAARTYDGSALPGGAGRAGRDADAVAVQLVHDQVAAHARQQQRVARQPRRAGGGDGQPELPLQPVAQLGARRDARRAAAGPCRSASAAASAAAPATFSVPGRRPAPGRRRGRPPAARDARPGEHADALRPAQLVRGDAPSSSGPAARARRRPKRPGRHRRAAARRARRTARRSPRPAGARRSRCWPPSRSRARRRAARAPPARRYRRRRPRVTGAHATSPP